MFSTAYASTATWNDTRWKNEQFDKMLIEARAELDDSRRRQIYHDMQLLVHNEGGAVIPVFMNYVFAASDKIGNGQLSNSWDVDGARFVERWWHT